MTICLSRKSTCTTNQCPFALMGKSHCSRWLTRRLGARSLRRRRLRPVKQVSEQLRSLIESTAEESPAPLRVRADYSASIPLYPLLPGPAWAARRFQVATTGLQRRVETRAHLRVDARVVLGAVLEWVTVEMVRVANTHRFRPRRRGEGPLWAFYMLGGRPLSRTGGAFPPRRRKPVLVSEVRVARRHVCSVGGRRGWKASFPIRNPRGEPRIARHKSVRQ